MECRLCRWQRSAPDREPAKSGGGYCIHAAGRTGRSPFPLVSFKSIMHAAGQCSTDVDAGDVADVMDALLMNAPSTGSAFPVSWGCNWSSCPLLPSQDGACMSLLHLETT